jgi:hypothetical protein
MTSADTWERRPTWRKSRYSIANGECVEVAVAHDGIMVRDSASPTSPVIRYTAWAWTNFLIAAKTGQFGESG